MRTRWVKPLVFLLVAAQFMLAVPATAFARVHASENSNHACDTMTLAAGSGDCPCCPDGASSMNDCLATCVLGAAVVTTRVLPARVFITATRVESTPPSPFTSYSAPPLKPPPIR